MASVVELGMELLRQSGQLSGLSEIEVESEDESEPESENPSSVELMCELMDRLERLADHLATQDTLNALIARTNQLTMLVEQLMVLVTAPRIKVPVRDEAGRIIEVREMMPSTDAI